MIKILYLILFAVTILVSTIQAQSTTAWYIDPTRSGAGTYDGRSWATAFRYPDNSDYWENNRSDGLDWALVQPGDTIYLSGGTDSLIWSPNALYQQSINPNGISMGTSPNASRSYSFYPGNPVIVTKGKDPGHNGKVIFDLDSNDDQPRAVTIMGLVNVVFTDLTFRNTRDPVADVGSSVISIGASQARIDSMITFDNCEFYTYGAGGIFGVATSDWTLKNSTVSVVRNNLVNGQDPFGFSSGTGGHTIDNNIIIVRNGYQVLPGNNIGNGVSVTDTSLTDTNLNMETNYHVNNSVWVNGYYMQITSNNSNTFYGDAWIFEPYVQNDGTGVTTTDTSLHDVNGLSWNRNILTGALIICEGDTLVLTSNFGTSFYGSNGWNDGSPPLSGNGYTIEGGGTPAGDSLKWFMGGPHRDIIQISNIGMAADTVLGGASMHPRKPFTISNNLILDPVPGGEQWNALIYNYGWTETPSIEFIIYNNIIATAKNKAPGILALGRINSARVNTVKMFNNTFIAKNGLLSEWSVDSITARNNIMIADTTISYFYSLDPGHDYRSIDYNFYAEQGGVPTDENFGLWNGNWRTWAQWVALPADTNSITTNSTSVTFTNKFGETKESYYTESGRDVGDNLWDEYPFLRTDAVGNPRPQSGSWDIGALEFQASTSDTVPSFTFTSITNAELGSRHIGWAVFSGADSTFHVWTVTSDSFKVGANSSFNLSMVEANSGDTLFVPNITSNLYSTANINYVIAGGNSQGFSVTTKDEPVIPPVLKKAIKSPGAYIRDSNGKLIRENR